VWGILDKYLSIADRNSINPKMFNSFVDGAKSGIEMIAVCNATELERDVAEGECLRWRDVADGRNDLAVKVRREMEAAFAQPNTQDS
jgi:predicted homoserine dehydrogenase-like protein